MRKPCQDLGNNYEQYCLQKISSLDKPPSGTGSRESGRHEQKAQYHHARSFKSAFDLSFTEEPQGPQDGENISQLEEYHHIPNEAQSIARKERGQQEHSWRATDTLIVLKIPIRCQLPLCVTAQALAAH